MFPSFKSSLRVVVLAAVVGLLAAPAASAREAFSGQACSLFTAGQVAKIVGDTNTGKYTCVASKTVKTPAGTTYGASSGSAKTAGGGFFTIQVVKYKSAAIEKMVGKQMYKSLPSVKGVGDWAYSQIKMSPVVGGRADAGEFAFGAKGYGVLITVRAKLKKTVNQPALKALAQKIVGEL